MRARSVALLLLALGCGLVASIGITQVIGNKDTESPEPTGDATTIFVALEDVPFNEPLTSQVLRLESWPKDKVPAGALCRIEDVEGRRTRTKLYVGEPILENKLFAEGATDGSWTGMIPKGYRVFSVKVDRQSGAGLILPGDRVDVLVRLFRDPGKGILKTSTRTILQDVKVFAVNDVVQTEGQDEKTITAQTISLLVKPEHAQLVMLAEELGKIRLVMRSPEDDDITTVEDTTPGQLLDAAEAEDRQQEGLLAHSGLNQSAGSGFLQYLGQLRAKKAGQGDDPPPARQTSAGNQHLMRIVSGPEVKDVLLEMDESQSGSGREVWRVRDWNTVSGSGPTDHSTSEPAEPAAQQEPGPAEKAEEDPLQPKPQQEESEEESD